MKVKPVIVQFTRQSVTITEMVPVPNADYLQPAAGIQLPLDTWKSLVRAPIEPGTATYVNFTPAQLAAHGVTAADIERSLKP